MVDHTKSGIPGSVSIDRAESSKKVIKTDFGIDVSAQ